MTLTGLDVCVRERFVRFRGERIGIVCNQASVSKDFSHVVDLALGAGVSIGCVFGPQHGIWGHTQDNMVEWEGYLDPRTGLRFYSLYGEHREPSAEMLAGRDRIVFDVPDVGARYYTFIWTLANCMRACERERIAITVLDRPNPISGAMIEGPVLQHGFESFVGLHPLPTRHGMTVGEVAMYFQREFYRECELSIVRMEGWKRESFLDETGVPWTMPSPNMPTIDTAIVYPGQCLLEGTNVSEGRGTTRPFEIFGAPWIDAWSLCSALNAKGLRGVYFRPCQFQPTFQKHSGQVCQGAFIHVIDRKVYGPVQTTVLVLQEIWKQCTEAKWNDPPYEYETKKLPIDILAGNDWLRPAIENGEDLDAVRARMANEAQSFEQLRQPSLIY